MPTSAFCRVNRHRRCLVCGKPDWCVYYVEFQPYFIANLFPLPLNLRTIGGKHRPAFFSGLLASALTTQTSLWLKTKKERGAGA